MVYTVDEFLSESKRCPVVIEMDGLYVPIDVGLFVATSKICGACIKAIRVTPIDYSGIRLLVLAGITWDAFLQTIHSAQPN